MDSAWGTCFLYFHYGFADAFQPCLLRWTLLRWLLVSFLCNAYSSHAGGNNMRISYFVSIFSQWIAVDSWRRLYTLWCISCGDRTAYAVYLLSWPGAGVVYLSLSCVFYPWNFAACYRFQFPPAWVFGAKILFIAAFGACFSKLWSIQKSGGHLEFFLTPM